MKILLIGATSLLGRKIYSSTTSNYDIVATYHTQTSDLAKIKLDITNPIQVRKVVKDIHPQIVIHTSSLGDIDYCENHQKEAKQINVEGTRNIVQAAKLIRAKCVFFSTNAVFDGKSPPYNERSQMHPLNYYGKTKVAAEKIVSSYFPQAIIFRLNTMYGWNDSRERNNPATWILDRFSKKLPTPVVTDIYNNHLWVGQAAQAVWKAIEIGAWGQIFHIAGKECLSRYQFACELARVFHCNEKLLKPVTSNYFAQLTPRAHNTCFATQKMERVLGVSPLSLKQGLQAMKVERT